GSRGLVELAQDLVDLDDVTLVLRAALEYPRLEGGYLDGDLVGLELDQRLALSHGVARVLEPAADGRLDDRLAERGHLDLDHASRHVLKSGRSFVRPGNIS